MDIIVLPFSRIWMAFQDTSNGNLRMPTNTFDKEKKDSINIKTPITDTTGSKFSNDCILVPVLRSGVALLYPFMNYFCAATVGFVGITRNEENAEPMLYYDKLPKISGNEDIIVLDPMIATGGTAEAAAKLIEISKGKVAAFIFVINLFDLGGCENLVKNGYKVENLMDFPGH